uniref:Uncharacterized protein n=1 Tax=Trichogramma kaykai TaxID=54128 RepID=A0ABD2WEE0_9HYME
MFHLHRRWLLFKENQQNITLTRRPSHLRVMDLAQTFSVGLILGSIKYPNRQTSERIIIRSTLSVTGEMEISTCKCHETLTWIQYLEKK